jgi:hypothetical protein
MAKRQGKTLGELSKDTQPKLAAGAMELKATVQQEVRQRRPGITKFTDEKWNRVLECVATYGDLISACDHPDMPSVATLYHWMRQNPELQEDMRQAWHMFSMIGHSVNNNILQGGKLSTGDFRRDEALAAQNRWFMGKTNRRDFGEKTQVDVVHHEPVIIDGTIIEGPGGDGV